MYHNENDVEGERHQYSIVLGMLPEQQMYAFKHRAAMFSGGEQLFLHDQAAESRIAKRLLQ
jgi:hypothetical protein